VDDVILLIVGLMFYSIVAYYGTTFKIYWDASSGVKRSIKRI